MLFTLASEVLTVTERLGGAEARRWAKWADEVFLQMYLEADVAAWRARVGIARGRCSLVTGIAHADEVEMFLGTGMEIWCSARRPRTPGKFLHR